jgi:hypothetical protein
MGPGEQALIFNLGKTVGVKMKDTGRAISNKHVKW